MSNPQGSNEAPRGIVFLDSCCLIPVIELRPWTLTHNVVLPESSVIDAPLEWDEFWSKMLNRTGFGHLTPIRSGSWHFRTSLFTESDLTVILPAIFDEYSESIEAEEPDESGALYGGMALCDENGGVLIEPTCCADLRNINSWNEAADYRKSTWQQVWIGHPWVSVKYEEPRLVFSDLHEHQDPVARWSICPEDLRFAIDQAEKELFQFSDKIGNSLRNIEYDGDVNVLSKNLAGVGDLRIS